jgi:hypothetical protein
LDLADLSRLKGSGLGKIALAELFVETDDRFPGVAGGKVADAKRDQCKPTAWAGEGKRGLVPHAPTSFVAGAMNGKG